jgi:hypothetical protein
MSDVESRTTTRGQDLGMEGLDDAGGQASR